MKTMVIILSLFSFFNSPKEEVIEINHDYLDSQIEISIDNFASEYQEYQDYIEKHTFNGESSEKIAKKINRYFNSNLKGKGEFVTEYSLKLGIDPYLAASVMLLETGCYWNCSTLAKQCNNYGGNKGKPGCNGGSYRKFATQEEGMKYAMKVLSNYYKKGLTTPKQINPKYATSKVWYKKVERYMKKLKKD